MKKLVQFVKESYAELRKVVWPGRDDVVSSIKVVIISTIIIALALGLVDALLLGGQGDILACCTWNPDGCSCFFLEKNHKNRDYWGAWSSQGKNLALWAGFGGFMSEARQTAGRR